MSNESHADIREMYMAHAMFRREIGLMPGLVRGVRAGDTERAATITGHYTLVYSVLHHHHLAEDTHLWPRLSHRAPAEAASVVPLLGDQHETIDKLGAEVEAGLGAWRERVDQASGAVIAEGIERLWEALTEHMAAEEEQALPLVQRHITATEWEEMVADGARGFPMEQMPLLTGLMMYEGDPGVVSDVIAKMPPEIRPVIAGLAGSAFAEYSSRVHGTPTPPKGSELR